MLAIHTLTVTIPELSYSVQLRELVFCRKNIESSALELGFARWKNDEDVGVGGEASYDEIKTRRFDCEFDELV